MRWEDVVEIHLLQAAFNTCNTSIACATSLYDDLTTAYIPSSLARGHKTGYKKPLDGRNQSNTCTAVPVRKGNGATTVLQRYYNGTTTVLQWYYNGTTTPCGIPSRITCNQQIPGTYPWYARVDYTYNASGARRTAAVTRCSHIISWLPQCSSWSQDRLQ